MVAASLSLCLVGAGLFGSACELYGQFPWQVRIPVEDVGARFVIADAIWFEDEQTLFFFYDVESNQGLSNFSQFEISYRTDEFFQPFEAMTALEPVHRHIAANCGTRRLCGSFSVAVELVPRDIQLRLRYHRDGELFLDAPLDVNIIGSGPPHNSRSAIVYGVFNEENNHVQWRLRHQFPTIRNQQAQELGLSRDFRIEDVSYGDIPNLQDNIFDNPYVYGAGPACPGNFTPHNNEVLNTSARAVFDFVPLPLDASTFPHVCAAATVFDALGEFTTVALAQKNPQTRPAFSELRSPIRNARPVRIFLEVCNQRTSDEHRDMQMQRLFLRDTDTFCIDDFDTLDFPSRLATELSQRVDQLRTTGDDLVLVIGLNRPNDSSIAMRVEEALEIMLPGEAARSSPRLSGVFVYDTRAYFMRSAEVARLTLWCPSTFGGPNLGRINDTSLRDCAVQPPFPITIAGTNLAQLPILPTEEQFENFIEEYGVNQTGRMNEMTFRSPIRTPISENVPVGDFGVATFFNNEAITPATEDAFSYCATEDTGLVVVRIPGFDDVFPLAFLGELHTLIGFNRYELGLFWEFPFLMEIQYTSTLAAAIEADIPDEIPLILAAGLSSPAEQFFGGFQWFQDVFEVGDALLQCTRFCDHPTFNSAGVYNIQSLFFDTYSQTCYRPRYPRLGDGGFPRDP
jgi:hypothetical protein